MDYAIQEKTIQETLDMLGLTFEARFVPFSQSRNKNEKKPSLNWKISILRDGMIIVNEIDFSMGYGHCPHFQQMERKYVGFNLSVDDKRAIDRECETGVSVVGKTHRIEPNFIDFVYSMLMDSMVLNYDSFEDWAPDFGYDPDSRSGEKVYNECRAVAQKFARLGSTNLAILEEAYEGY